MKILQRICLGILLLCLLALSVALVFVAWQGVPQSNLETFINVIYTFPVNAWLLTIIGVALFIMTLIAIFGGRGKKSAGKQPVSATALIRASDIGATYISITALDTMVQKFTRSNQRIKDCSSRVVADNNCIAIHLRLALMPDTNVVELTEVLQIDLKKYIETLTGIIVREVHILVESVSINPSARVD